MEESVARVAAAADIDPAIARSAIGIMLAFMKTQAPPDDVAALFAAFPGADEAAAAGTDGGGALGGFMGLFGGGVMGVAARLAGLGLGPTQMQTIGRTLLDMVRARLGDARADAIAAAIPGLPTL